LSKGQYYSFSSAGSWGIFIEKRGAMVRGWTIVGAEGWWRCRTSDGVAAAAVLKVGRLSFPGHCNLINAGHWAGAHLGAST